MNSKNRYILTSVLVILLLFISGCITRPYLTKDNSYFIQVFSHDDKSLVKEIPINLSWNSNEAVTQKLLLEASFVMSDLSSDVESANVISRENKKLSSNNEVTNEELIQILYLKAVFPEAKKFNLVVDNKSIDMDIQSVQIEIRGNNPGRVILNQTTVLQGIPNSNLEPAFNEFIAMLVNHSEIKILEERNEIKKNIDKEDEENEKDEHVKREASN